MGDACSADRGHRARVRACASKSIDGAGPTCAFVCVHATGVVAGGCVRARGRLPWSTVRVCATSEAPCKMTCAVIAVPNHLRPRLDHGGGRVASACLRAQSGRWAHVRPGEAHTRLRIRTCVGDRGLARCVCTLCEIFNICCVLLCVRRACVRSGLGNRNARTCS